MAETEKTGNGGNDSGKPAVTPAPEENSAAPPAKPAVEESKQAGVSVETLPKAAPVAEMPSEKTGNGGNDSGKAGVTPTPEEKFS